MRRRIQNLEEFDKTQFVESDLMDKDNDFTDENILSENVMKFLAL